MKRLFAATLGLIFLILASPFGAAAETPFRLTAEESAQLEALKKRPLRLAYSYELLIPNTAGGRRLGILEPFVTFLEDELGLTVETVRLDWTAAFKALHKQEIDFYGLIALSPERRQAYTAIDPIFEADLETVTRVDRPLGDLLNLSTKKIGVLTGSILSTCLRTYLYPHGEVKTYPTMEAILDALSAGEIDCLATVDHAEVEILKRPELRYEFTVPNAHFQQGFLSGNQEMRPLIDIVNRYLRTPEGRKLMEDTRRTREEGILQAAREIMTDDITQLRSRFTSIPVYDPGMQDPLGYFDDGTFHGLQTDINHIFAELTGVPIETHTLEELPQGMESALTLLRSGAALAISGRAFNLDQNDDVGLVYSLPVWRDTLRLYAKRGSGQGQPSLDIGALTGDDNYASWLSAGSHISRTYQTYPRLLSALGNGEVNAAFISEQVFDYLYNIRGDDSLHKIGNVSAIANVRLLLNRNNPHFNRLMNAAIMLQQMIHTRSQVKWLNQAADYKYQYLRIVDRQKITTVLVGAVFTLMLAVLVYLLRRHIVYDRQVSHLLRNQRNFDLAWGDLKTKRFSSKGNLSLLRKWGLQVKKEVRTLDDLSEGLGWDIYDDYRDDFEEMARRDLRFIERDKAVISPLDGRPRYYRRYLHRLRDREFMACLLDITDEKNRDAEQRANEQVLKEAAQAANEASRTKSIFLANMSHEIRTPMNGIIGFAELALDDENLSPKAIDRLVKIKNSAGGLLCIINDILDLSKIEAGEFTLERIPFELRDLLRDCETISALRAEEKGLQLYFYLEPTLDRKLLGDPTKLRQVLLNLLSNAIKFTPSGMVKLMTLLEIKEDQVFLQFEVKDTGIGIPADKLQTIFEAFKQADSTTTRQFGGTGLGLAITKNIVEQMGGFIEVESIPGVGSKFRVTLALDMSDEAVDQTRPSNDPVVGLTRPTFVAEALVCEDNRINQQVIAEHLEKLGIVPTVVDNGKAGVEEVRRCATSGRFFDLILMDIHMPVMDGLEATSKLIEMGVKAPIIALTANAMAKDRETYLQAGMTDYISKPFRAQELWACLLKYLVPVNEEYAQPLPASPAGSDEDEAKQRLLSEIARYCDMKAPVINIFVGLERSGGNAKLYKKLLLDFCRDQRHTADQLSAACQSGEVALAHRLAHTTKSVSATIGATRLSELAGNIEEILKTEPFRPSGEILRDFGEALAAVLRFLAPLVEANGKATVSPESVDRDQARTACAALRPLLETGNMGSLKRLESLRAILLPLGAQCAILLTRIEDCDFDLALETLGEIEAGLEAGHE